VSERRLPWPWFAAAVAVYAAIIQGGGLLIGVSSYGDSQFPTTESVVRNGLLPIGLSIVFAAGIVTWLGWWDDVLRCDRPVRHWVRLVPISMLAAALLGTNYGHLAGEPAGLVVSVVVLCVFVGVGEELMFRGLGVNVFRHDGFSEGRVALYSSLAFGLVHVSNAIGHGPQALLQAAVVSTSGYFFYLALRVAGTLLVPMLVHGTWDFGLLSNSVGYDQSAGIGIVLPILVQLALIVLLLRRRHRIEPGELTASPSS
jgi:membrane protease YdiL (CAAX protease family)